jgi:hypothetical protein
MDAGGWRRSRARGERINIAALWSESLRQAREATMHCGGWRTGRGAPRRLLPSPI